MTVTIEKIKEVLEKEADWYRKVAEQNAGLGEYLTAAKYVIRIELLSELIKDAEEMFGQNEQ